MREETFTVTVMRGTWRRLGNLGKVDDCDRPVNENFHVPYSPLPLLILAFVNSRILLEKCTYHRNLARCLYALISLLVLLWSR